MGHAKAYLLLTLLKDMGDQGRQLKQVAGVLRDQRKKPGLEVSLRLTGSLR
jgi:hypothetical protein